MDTLASWKKEYVKMLKDWDKNYCKHMSKKGTYEEMNTLHMTAAKPLAELIESNKNFHHLELMIEANKKKGNQIPVPEFRYRALQEKFCQKLTAVCELFRDYGTDRLEDHFDIK
jgi:hypothetical protein